MPFYPHAILPLSQPFAFAKPVIYSSFDVFYSASDWLGLVAFFAEFVGFIDDDQDWSAITPLIELSATKEYNFLKFFQNIFCFTEQSRDFVQNDHYLKTKDEKELSNENHVL